MSTRTCIIEASKKYPQNDFGIGYFPGKGSMSGRVVIPIHNERGELVAYAGRAIDQTEPKYKLPAGFKKSAVLFNLHRVRQRHGDHRRRILRLCESESGGLRGSCRVDGFIAFSETGRIVAQVF